MPPVHPVHYPSQVEGARVLWLLTLTWAGHTIRVSDDEVDVETEDGDVLHYHAGLGDVEVTEGMTLGGAASSSSPPMQVLFPEDVDVCLLEARGHDLSTARGELARWIEGTTWEQRRPVVVGRVADPRTWTSDDPVEFTLEDSIAEDARLTPAIQVDGANFAHADTVPEEDIGADLPVVFGRPGAVSTAIQSNGHITGGWARWIDMRRDLGTAENPNLVELRAAIASHHVQVTSVYVSTDTDPSPAYRIRVANGTTEKGRPYAFLCWFESAGVGAPEDDYDAGYRPYGFSSGGGGPTDRSGLGYNSLPGSFNQEMAQRLYVSFVDDDNPSAGGLVQNGRLIREAADLLTWLFGLTSLRVDRGAMQAVATGLSRIKFDGTILERTNIWAFLRDEILPLLPVSVATGPNGLYVIPWRFAASAADASIVFDADVDPEVELLGPVEREDGERFNRIVVKYAYAFRLKEYLGRVVIGTKDDVDEAIVSEATAGAGWISVDAIPAAGDTLTIGGQTWTAVAGTAGAGEFPIGATRVLSALLLAATLNGAASKVTAGIDSGTNTQVNVTAITAGAASNMALSTTGGNLSVSGAAMTGGADEEKSNYVRANAYCQASRDALQEVREKVVETAFVYDDSSALAIGEWMAAAYAPSARFLQLRVPEAPYIHVRRGAVALITASERELYSVPAVVREIITDGSGYLRVKVRFAARAVRRGRAG